MAMNKQIIENIMTDYNNKRLKAAHEADKKRKNYMLLFRACLKLINK